MKSLEEKLNFPELDSEAHHPPAESKDFNEDIYYDYQSHCKRMNCLATQIEMSSQLLLKEAKYLSPGSEMHKDLTSKAKVLYEIAMKLSRVDPHSNN